MIINRKSRRETGRAGRVLVTDKGGLAGGRQGGRKKGGGKEGGGWLYQYYGLPKAQGGKGNAH